jgi:hypothetical protein
MMGFSCGQNDPSFVLEVERVKICLIITLKRYEMPAPVGRILYTSIRLRHQEVVTTYKAYLRYIFGENQESQTTDEPTIAPSNI